MKSMRDQIKGWCIHSISDPRWTKDKTITCKAGVSYYDLCRIDELGFAGCGLRRPCGGDKAGRDIRGHKVEPCDQYTPPTEEAIQKEIDDWEESKRCLMEGISFCCKAPIDESRAIKDGPHKGHGPRFCSNCRKLVYMV